MTFVVSTRGDRDDERLAAGSTPALRFKLDPTPELDDELVAALSAPGIVNVADLKDAYRGAVVDNPPNAELYRRVAEGLPRRLDRGSARSTPRPIRCSSRAATGSPGMRRSIAGPTSRPSPFQPRSLNAKPSRFGSVERLFEFYDRCTSAGCALYGGGSSSRRRPRPDPVLAALFHPEGPNDAAPAATTRTRAAARAARRARLAPRRRRRAFAGCRA